MQALLAITGLLMMIFIITRCRAGVMRKCLSLSLIPLSCVICAVLFQTTTAIFIVLAMWLLVPAIEIYFRHRGIRIEPVRQIYSDAPSPYLIPHTESAIYELEEAGYEEVDECSWRWEGMNKHFTFYWHPEKRAITSLVICEQANLVFSYLNIRSFNAQGEAWRTTNFPYSPLLAPLPKSHLKRIPCEETSFLKLQKRHDDFLKKYLHDVDDLIIPNPESIRQSLKEEILLQIQHNIDAKLIKHNKLGNYTYTPKGIGYRWITAITDLIRLC